jgi:pSer/pThr/pTyr-binding forkhead associated (FHA) protein
MSQLTVTVLQLGLLALLWLFVVSVVGVLRRDLYGTRVVQRPTAATPAGAPAPARPAPRAAPRPAEPPAPREQPAPAVPRHLVVTEGPLTGTTIDLDRSPVLIGRAPECTLVLADDYASSRHARLVPQDGRWLLEDLGSTNGTTVAPGSRGGRGGAEAVRGSVDVTVGSVIRIGRTALELRR